MSVSDEVEHYLGQTVCCARKGPAKRRKSTPALKGVVCVFGCLLCFGVVFVLFVCCLLFVVCGQKHCLGCVRDCETGQWFDWVCVLASGVNTGREAHA